MPRKKKQNIQVLTLINKPKFKRLLKDVPEWVEEKAFWLFGDDRVNYTYIPASKIPLEVYRISKLDGSVEYKINSKYVILKSRTFVIQDKKIYYKSSEKEI